MVTLKKAQERVLATRMVLAHIVHAAPSVRRGTKPFKVQGENDIYIALLELSEPLAISYAQVKTDLRSSERCSWAGTAHEIREVIVNILRLLAPDERVKGEAWYKQEPKTSGPTQKQRVHFILQQRHAGSKEREVAEHASKLEEMIEEVVRSSYSRASDAAHRFKSKKEVVRIVEYFDVFARDLLDLG